MEPVLRVSGLSAGYGGGDVIRNLDFSLHSGTVTVLLGPNGSGKTSTLLSIAGELKTTGTVAFHGSAWTIPFWRRSRGGLAYIPDEHAIIGTLTVAENLRMAMRDPSGALELFPELADHRRRPAGLLSGGQQKMLSLAMALAKKPDVLMADELSLGLAPQIVHRLLEVARRAADAGTAVLLVEQHAQQALAVADRGLVLSHGSLVADEDAATLRADTAELAAAYLGPAAGNHSAPSPVTSANGHAS